MDYKDKQFIAQVDKNDTIKNKIEKWEAHRKGILHRAFTCVLIYNDQYLLQKRKHKVFDKFYDLSFSSHPVYKENSNILQPLKDAIYQGLEREWNLKKTDLKTKPEFLGKFYYLAEDLKSKFFENEIDHIYQVQLNKLPKINKTFAYEFQLIKIIEIRNWKIKISFAPWVKFMFANKLI